MGQGSAPTAARRLCRMVAAAACGLTIGTGAAETHPPGGDVEAQGQSAMRCQMVAGWPTCVVAAGDGKDERLQDVPLSITAFTTVEIERRNLRGLADVAEETPGLVYESYANSGLSSAAVVRGMGQTSTTARIQNTAVFLDGIYLQRQSMLGLGVADFERVEVVKGPQNAQFGRNAFAGVIQYVSKRPTDTLAGNIALTYGSGGRFERHAGVAGPLMDDKLFGRLAVSETIFDGHTDNQHPFAEYGPPGGTNQLLGGRDDRFYTAALTWLPAPRWEIGATAYVTEARREPQPYYDLDGARYVYDSGEFAGLPTAANCLDTETDSNRLPFPAVGLHTWCGELPSSPPVLDDARLRAAGFGATQGRVVVDPRSVALDAASTITRVNMRYDLSDATFVEYRLGHVEHEADSMGTVGGRASLVGSVVPYMTAERPSGAPSSSGSAPAFEAISIFNATPMEKLKATSHQLRATWMRDHWVARAGAYFTSSEDEDGSMYRFVAPCDRPAVCRVSALAASSPMAGRHMAPDKPHVFATGHAARGDHALYSDDVTALFGDVQWPLAEALTISLEARYTRERKTFEQLSPTFGGSMPPGVTTNRSGTLGFFTPRATFKWMPAEANMLYASVAKGVKTGGFNAVDVSQSADQASYDEERNVTVEIGVKNRLFADALTFNAALFWVDWQDIQGSEAPSSRDAWTRDVIGNIGDADVVGFEIGGAWSASPRFFIDYAAAYNDARYDQAIYFSAMAGPYSSWGCDDSVCRADGRVDGKRVERTSKSQYGVGFNYAGKLANAWRFDARVDFNHRGRMFATPLNLAANGGRTLANATFNLKGGHWRLALWSRNLFDEEYVGNSFVVPSFTRYIVALGARRTFGLTVRYTL